MNLISDDIFGIDEITLYTGKHSDKVYAVAGEIIDGVSNDIYSIVSLYVSIKNKPKCWVQIGIPSNQFDYWSLEK